MTPGHLKATYQCRISCTITPYLMYGGREGGKIDEEEAQSREAEGDGLFSASTDWTACSR